MLRYREFGLVDVLVLVLVVVTVVIVFVLGREVVMVERGRSTRSSDIGRVGMGHSALCSCCVLPFIVCLSVFLSASMYICLPVCL